MLLLVREDVVEGGRDPGETDVLVLVTHLGLDDLVDDVLLALKYVVEVGLDGVRVDVLEVRLHDIGEIRCKDVEGDFRVLLVQELIVRCFDIDRYAFVVCGVLKAARFIDAVKGVRVPCARRCRSLSQQFPTSDELFGRYVQCQEWD